MRGVLTSVLGDDQRRRHARRRRHRSRHRVVPQRALARLQDRRRASIPTSSSQFPLLEEALAALGVAVWPMIEFEADDALAAAAAQRGGRPAVERVFICTPDKDLAQCVRGDARRPVESPDARGHRTKPASSRSSACCRSRSPTTSRSSATRPTGIPGCRGGARSRAAAVLAKFGHLEAHSRRLARRGSVNATSAATLARTLARAARPRAALPHARDAAHRRAGVRVDRRPAMEGPDPALRGDGQALRCREAGQAPGGVTSFGASSPSPFSQQLANYTLLSLGGNRRGRGGRRGN